VPIGEKKRVKAMEKRRMLVERRGSSSQQPKKIKKGGRKSPFKRRRKVHYAYTGKEGFKLIPERILRVGGLSSSPKPSQETNDSVLRRGDPRGRKRRVQAKGKQLRTRRFQRGGLGISKFACHKR